MTVSFINPYQYAAGLVLPYVDSDNGVQTSSNTTLALNVPGGTDAAGDLFLWISQVGSTQASCTTPAGYTQLIRSSGAASTIIFYKWRAGGEVNVSATVGTSARKTTKGYRIKGLDPTQNPVLSAVVTGTTGTTINPAAITHGWGVTKNTLVLATLGVLTNTTTVSVWPLTGGQNTVNNNSVISNSWCTEVQLLATVDPTTFTFNAGTALRCFTIAMKGLN